ncbi:MAG: phosphoribosylaminoimidazolesuccinocarboxamide synthase [Actinobacteria bacterium]|nr:phosphoribosylaminoimidazolesuccinocarboxamide synthase [Actinomycetota bacterium]
MTINALLRTEIADFPATHGKVRDIYDLGSELLIVATDRISAFDVIMPNGIPDKGKILTQMSLFWFDFLGSKVKHHLISADIADFPAPFQAQSEVFAGRSMLVKKADVLPVECVVRGYLAGSGWKDYQATGKICGIELPAGLKQCEKLPEPIFTPATKATSGHDENIPFEEAVKTAGQDVANSLREKSIDIYLTAADYAASHGVIISDTKFEWGQLKDELILVDEILTPDSSRFWPADKYQPGRDQDSFDKQFVRNYLETCDWDKTPPAPELPDDIVSATREKYLDAFRRLTGKEFSV